MIYTQESAGRFIQGFILTGDCREVPLPLEYEPEQAVEGTPALGA
jgi:hypothetical protein